MADSSTNNLAQHVAAAFIGRDHAIGNQKSRGARVVSNDAQGSVISGDVPSD